MRAKIWIGSALGLGMSVTVSLGQAPPRKAVLLPPRAADPTELPVVRAAAEELPPFPDTTPVRSTPVKPAGPAWLNGTDGYLKQAGASTTSGKSPVQPLSTTSGRPKDESTAVSKGIEKLKGTLIGEKGGPANPPSGYPAPSKLATAPDQATAATAFKGTGENGQPVYAGPPAYRWYGWGTVTPGANPLAPAGQYPAASANWHMITGATPGAFPVPVTNQGRPVVGTAPPTYTGPSRIPPTIPAAPPPPRTPLSAVSVIAPEPTRHALPVMPPAPPPAIVMTDPAPPAPPVAVPTITPLPTGVAPAMPPVPPAAPAKDPEPPAPRVAPAPAPITIAPISPPTAEPPPALPPLPTLPAVGPVQPVRTAVMGEPPHSAPAAPPVTPAPLPVSVTEVQPKWQPNTAPQPGEQWRNPHAPSGEPEARWVNPAGATVARGQAPDTKPDPVATLIKKVCERRAEGVDVRWTGTKKLTVCFEVRTAPDAQKLVNDLSARPELAPYQIDFCVLVK